MASLAKTPPGCAYSKIVERVQQEYPDIPQYKVDTFLRILRETRTTLNGLCVDEVVQEVKKMIANQMSDKLDRPPGYEPLVKECSICLDVLHTRPTELTRCKHEFHEDCLVEWLKTKSICPLCKTHVLMDQDYPSL